MVGDFLLGLIILCIAVLVGYPLINLFSVNFRDWWMRRRAAQR